MLAIDPKRRKPDERVDPRNVLATYLAGKFAQAGWQASYDARQAAMVAALAHPTQLIRGTVDEQP